MVMTSDANEGESVTMAVLSRQARGGRRGSVVRRPPTGRRSGQESQRQKEQRKKEEKKKEEKKKEEKKKADERKKEEKKREEEKKKEKKRNENKEEAADAKDKSTTEVVRVHAKKRLLW